MQHAVRVPMLLSITSFTGTLLLHTKVRSFLARIVAATILSSPVPALSQGGADARFNVPTSVDAGTAAALKASYLALRALRPLPKPESLADWDRQNAVISGIMGSQARKLADSFKVNIVKDRLGDIPIIRLRPAGYKPSARTFIYLHGGGYTLFSAENNINVPVMFAAISGQEVISVDYTLAPRSKWSVTTDQVLAVYRSLIRGGHPAKSIGIFGDSAGGGLAAGSVLKMRDSGLPIPGGLWLLSPWTDLTMEGDTEQTMAGEDPILNRTQLSWSAAAYADIADQRNPYASPVYGDYSEAFPPTLLQAGTHELLLSDTVREYQAIRSGGHVVVLDLYEGLPHVFQAMVPETPDTRKSIERAIAFFNDHLEPEHDRAGKVP